MLFSFCLINSFRFKIACQIKHFLPSFFSFSILYLKAIELFYFGWTLGLFETHINICKYVFLITNVNLFLLTDFFVNSSNTAIFGLSSLRVDTLFFLLSVTLYPYKKI